MGELNMAAPFVGLNLLNDESTLAPNEATVALNVNLDRGTIKKRDGYTQVTNNGECRGIFDWRKSSGVGMQIYKAGTKLFKIIGDSVTELLPSGLTSETLADFAAFYGRVYMVDNGTFKITDGTTVHNVEIAPYDMAGDAPTVNLVADGNIGGEFDYKFTYYSSTWLQESPASAASVVQEIPAKGKNVAFTDIERSADARVDKIRIYRRNISAMGILWFLAGEIANPGAGTASFTDDNREEDLSLTIYAPLEAEYNFNTSLKARYLELHKGTMFLAGDDSNVYFSLVDRPTVIDGKAQVGADSHQGKVTGLLSWKGLLYVFKEDSIWSVDGLTVETMTTKSLVQGTGCSAGHSIVVAGDAAYFWGEDGIYAFDGNKVSEVSAPVKELVMDRNRSQDEFVFGANDKENGCIIWSYCPAGVATPTRCLVFFYRNSGVVKSGSWATWEFKQADGSKASLRCMARVTKDVDTMDRKLFYGFDHLSMAEPGGVRDDSTADFDLNWTTGKWDGETPHRNKMWTNLTIEIDPQPVGVAGTRGALKIKYFLDEDKSGTAELRNIVHAVNTVRIPGRGRDIKFEIVHNGSSTGINIHSMFVEGNEAGRVRSRRT